MKQQCAIPGSWARTTIGATAEIVRGVSFPKDARKLVPHPGHVACLRTANVQREVEWDDLWFVPEEYVKVESRYVQPLDVLISVSNSLALVGKVAQVTNLPQKSTLGAFISLLRPSSGLDAKFYYYQMASPEVQSEIRYSASTTTNISNISSGKLSAVTLEVPPLAEQHRIVVEIETQFTRLDASVAALRRAQANLKRYRASVLKAACEGWLVPTESELSRTEGRDYEPAGILLKRILAERRARWESQETRRGKYKEPSTPDASAQPELPEGWVWAYLDQLIYLLEGGTAVTATSNTSSRKVLRSSAVRHGFIDLDDHRYLPEDAIKNSDPCIAMEDLLFTRLSGTLGYVGNCAVVGELGDQKIEFPDRIFRGRCTSSASPHYIQNCFSTQTLREDLEAKAKSSAGHQRISLSDLREFRIPLPPLAEQRRIVAEVERRLSVIQQAEATVEASLAQAERLRQSILKQAFSGKLVPQDPDDEPASALLERIKAEREAAQASTLSGRGPKPRRAQKARA